MMDDSPDHIKKKQLEIWLSKTPAERIRQFCLDNDMLFQFWRKTGNPHLQQTFPINKVASSNPDKAASKKGRTTDDR